MSSIVKISVLAVLAMVIYGAMQTTAAPAIDAYDDLMGDDEKMLMRMLELIDSIGSDDDETSSRYQSVNGPKSAERCLLPMRKGVCRALIPRWSYDPIAKKCREFTFGGCDGNGNNFATQRSCMDTCKGM